jgi:hypothetical protein
VEMASYLKEMHFAVGEVLDGLWNEREALERLQADIARLTQRVQQTYERAEMIAHDPLDAEDVMLATGMYWDNYFGDDKENYGKVQVETEQQSQLDTKQFSLSALAGTALQYAKQGISVVHGSFGACPDGRRIGSLTLKTVVWQGRNQASHWEDGRLHPPVVSCFQALESEQGAVFGAYNQRSLASEVVGMLDWRDWQRFEQDMSLLA